MKLTQKKSEILRIIADFDANKVDWTLNQFEQEFFHYSNHGNVKEVFENRIQSVKGILGSSILRLCVQY